MCSNWPVREPVHGKGEFKCRLFSSLSWLYISLVLIVFLCTSSFRYVSGLCLLGYLVYMLAIFVLPGLVDNYQVPVVLLISQPSWFFACPKETTNLRFGNCCCSLLVAEIFTWQLIMHQETSPPNGTEVVFTVQLCWIPSLTHQCEELGTTNSKNTVDSGYSYPYPLLSWLNNQTVL